MPGDPGRPQSGPGRGRAQDLGRQGEAEAARWYEAAGFTVLERNWRSPFGGELDLVCRRADLLVVCEVKARTSERFGSPVEAVDGRKRLQLRRLAGQYLAGSGPGLRGVRVRFDVAARLPGGGLVVVEDAFG